MTSPDGLITIDKKHSKVSELLQSNLLDDGMLKTLSVFATVRNPFDMVLSNYFFEKQIYERFKSGIWKRMLLGRKTYFYLRKKLHFDRTNEFSWIMPQAHRYLFTVNHSFEEYLAKFYSKKGKNIYLDYTRGADVHFLKLENITEELEVFFNRIGIDKKVELPHLSKSYMKKDNYRSYYTERSRQIVENSFKNELEMFKYEF